MSEEQRCPVCGHTTQRLAKHVFTYMANEPAHATYADEQRRLARELFHKEVPIGKTTDLTQFGLIIGREQLTKIWKEAFGEDAVRRRANWSRAASNAQVMLGNSNHRGVSQSKRTCPVCGRTLSGLWRHLCTTRDPEHAELRAQQEAAMRAAFENDDFTAESAEAHGVIVGYRTCTDLWGRWFTAAQREARSRRMISKGVQAHRAKVGRPCTGAAPVEPDYPTDACPVCGKRYASLWTHLLQQTDDAHRLALADLTERINGLFNDLSFNSGVDPHDRGVPAVYTVCTDVWKANFGDEAVRDREQQVSKRKISKALKGRVFTDEHRANLTDAQQRLSIDVTKYIDVPKGGDEP